MQRQKSRGAMQELVVFPTLTTLTHLGCPCHRLDDLLNMVHLLQALAQLSQL
jgi:hypothetical protein